ncbi:glycoside hydrolase family protein [Bradyrhizobium elkanii]
MFSVVGQFLTRSYNAGTSAVCKSPMLARINDGDFRGACAALLTKQKGQLQRLVTSARRARFFGA